MSRSSYSVEPSGCINSKGNGECKVFSVLAAKLTEADALHETLGFRLLRVRAESLPVQGDDTIPYSRILLMLRVAPYPWRRLMDKLSDWMKKKSLNN
jgi:hypothetical protein